MRRKILIIILIIAAIFALGIPGASAYGESDGIVRVILTVGTPTSISFYVDGNYTVLGNDSVRLERQLYTVKNLSGNLYLYYGGTRLCGGGSTLRLVQHEATEGRNNFIVMYNADQSDYFGYLGDIEFHADSGHVQATEYVYIEDYVYGVVPFEIGEGSATEALKAQAVAARSYAAGGAANWSLTDDSSKDQVYKGYDPTKPHSIAAVDATAGQMITYNGNVIATFYSADNGGWTDLPLHRWGSGSIDWPFYAVAYDPYDQANPSSRYETIFLPASNLEYLDGSTIKNNAAISHNVGSGPNAANLIFYIKQCIVNYNNGQLPGNVTNVNDFLLTGITEFCTTEPFDVTYDSEGHITRDHRRTQDLDKDGNPDPNLCMDRTGASGTFTVALLDGTPYTVSITGMDLNQIDSIGTTYRAFDYSSLSLTLIEPVNPDGVLTGFNVSQRRWGHSLGMSQRGAQMRAKPVEDGGAGQNYQDIISFYYPNTILDNRTYPRPVLTPIENPAEDHSNAAIVGEKMNVRSGAGTGYTLVGKLPVGARIMVVDPNPANAWQKIVYGGVYRYIAGTGVLLDDDINVPSYTVKFETNGGSTKPDLTLREGSCISTAPTAVKTGYTLEGWYTDVDLTNKVSFPYIVMGDATLYANWNITTYTISYNLDGGKLAVGSENPPDYTIETPEFTLNNPTRVCYAFTGWMGTGLSAATTAVTIPSGSYGSRSYTANWYALVPDKISAVFMGPDSASVTWSGVEGAVGYEVMRATSSAGTYRIVSGEAPLTETAFADAGLTAGAAYYYKVVAFFNDGENIVKGVLSSPVLTVPLPPAAVTANANDYSSITVSWDQVPGVTGYMVYRSTKENGTYTKIATTSLRSYKNTGLYTGTPYYYKVCAYRYSTSIYGGYSPVATAVTNLMPMADVSAKTYYPTSIKISWKAVPGSTGYEVYRSDIEGAEPVFHKYATSTYLNDTGLTVDKTYYYKVRAYRLVNGVKQYNDKSGIVSDMARVFQVTNPKAAMYTVTSNKITWSSVTGASGYEVYRCDAEGNITLTLTPTTAYTYYYDKNLIPNTTYNYKVKAYRTVGTDKKYGPESVAVSAMPVFNDVTNVNALMYSVTSNKITWSAVSGSTGYEVWWSESESGGYTQLTDPNQTYSSAYIYHQNLEGNGKPYYYRVVAYVTVNGKREHSTEGAATAYNKVNGVKGSMYSVNSNKISWNSVSGRTGYEVYWAESPTGPYTNKLTPENVPYTSTYFYHKNIGKGTTYYYKVLAYQTAGGVRKESDYSDYVSVANKVTGEKAVCYSYNSNKITWSAVTSRTGYEVWRSLTQNEEDFVMIVPKSTVPYTSTYYTDTGLTTDTTYFYKIRAYQMINGEKIYCNFSEVVNAKPQIKGVTGLKIYWYSSTRLKLLWYSVPGATGYEIECSLTGNETDFSDLMTTNLVYAYNSGLTPGTKYYYRVRAYRTVGTNTYFGDWSQVVSRTT